MIAAEVRATKPRSISSDHRKICTGSTLDGEVKPSGGVATNARIPIIKWMRDQASEGMNHAAMAGEHVTTLGGHPSLKIGKLTESHKHDIDQILREALEHERETLDLYYELLQKVEGKAVWLEEYARDQIQLEEGHIAEIEKMLRRPGDLKPAR